MKEIFKIWTEEYKKTNTTLENMIKEECEIIANEKAWSLGSCDDEETTMHCENAELHQEFLSKLLELKKERNKNMKTFIYEGEKLHLKRSTYFCNNTTYIGLFTEDDEPYSDVTINTDYSAINTIVIHHDFLNCFDDDFINEVISYLCPRGKIKDVQCGYVILPKYWLDMNVLREIEVIE